MKASLLLKLSAVLASVAADSSTMSLNSNSLQTSSMISPSGTAVDVVEFENVGYTGFYFDVSSLGDETADSCSCSLNSTFTVFEGSNSPLNEELSVHFRGPLSLKLFGYYTANDSSSGTWLRNSYYNASAQTADNVTFLNAAGAASGCLGPALSYSPVNGTGFSSESTILEQDNLIESNDEYVLYSGESCPSSGFSNACGVYRLGIPAYHGFGGTTKMFLFEFTMPETTSTNKEIQYYNMPAIWFLNAKIPRTSQYSMNSSCSCWNSGCGEIDVFEVLNGSFPLKLTATIHDYQGTDSINYGVAADGYFVRDTSSVMKGGVRFGTDGTISIFLLDSLSLDESIDASEVDSWISGAGTENTKSLSSVTLNTSTTSKKSGSNLVETHGFLSALVTLVMLALLYI